MSARGNNRNRNRAPLGGGTVAVDVGILPLPSALDGRRYTIRESGGVNHPAWVERTGDDRGRMQVPTGDTPGERRIRLHEMAHVRWSPARPSLPEGVTPETMNAVEDRRMHRRLREVGYQTFLDAPIFTSEDWSNLQGQFEMQDDEDNPREPFPDIEVARMIVASDGTAEGARFRRMGAENRGRQWIADLVDSIMDKHGLRGRRPAWKLTLLVAEEIDRTFREMDEMPQGLRNQLPEASADDGRGWGEMGIREMPLVERLPRGIKERNRRASDTGAVPRNWHRLCSDGAVFTRNVKRPTGGTVLIDQSGSMSLDVDEVVELMTRFPGVTVATYAGEEGEGELRIIARNGRRASDSDCFHPMGNNVVDGPALDWLCEQSSPRIWISDGYVTGAGCGMTTGLLMDAAEKVKKGRIMQVDRMGDLLPEGGGPA